MVARIYGDFIFGKIRFWGCPKIKGFRDFVFGIFPKNIKFGIFAKNKRVFLAVGAISCILKKKGGLYEKEELQRCESN